MRALGGLMVAALFAACSSVESADGQASAGGQAGSGGQSGATGGSGDVDAGAAGRSDAAGGDAQGGTSSNSAGTTADGGTDSSTGGSGAAGGPWEDVSDADLIARWAFDDGEGNQASDSSPNKYWAALKPDDTGALWTQGLAGGALAFDGTDDFLELGDSLTTVFPITIATWVKVDTTTLRCPVLMTDDHPDAHSGIYLEIYPGGDLSFAWGTGGGFSAAYRRSFAAAGAVPDEVWAHVAVTVASAAEVTLYVDGEAIAEEDVQTSGTGGDTPGYSDAIATIARRSVGGAAFCKGLLDELRFYGRALSANEIATLATRP